MDDALVAQLAARVGGYMHADDCVQLYRLLRETALDGAVLEIGSFKGRVTVCLAAAQREKNSTPVYTVDSGLFEGRNEFTENINNEGMGSWVVPIIGNSAQVNSRWTKPLSFIWIDTDATVFSLAADFRLWERFLQVGGVFAYGGANNKTVSEFTEKYFRASGRFGEVRTGSWIVYARKERSTPPLSAAAYMRIRMLYRMYYLVKSIHHRWAGRFLARDHALKRILRFLFQRLLR